VLQYIYLVRVQAAKEAKTVNAKTRNASFASVLLFFVLLDVSERCFSAVRCHEKIKE